MSTVQGLKQFKAVITDWQRSIECSNQENLESNRKAEVYMTLANTLNGIPYSPSDSLVGECWISDDLKEYEKELNELKVSSCALSSGRYDLLYKNDSRLFVFIRSMFSKRALIILNFSDDVVPFETKAICMPMRLKYTFGNYEKSIGEDHNNIRPYEARIYMN